jgi:hypothetical protein
MFQMVGAKYRVKTNRKFFGANPEILGVETGNLRAEIQTGVEGTPRAQARYVYRSAPNRAAAVTIPDLVVL